MLESVIQKRIKDYATLKGWLVRKFATPSNRSTPDLIMFRSGVVVLIEVKQKGKMPRKQQLREFDLYRSYGHTVHIVDSVEQGKKLIDLLTIK